VKTFDHHPTATRNRVALIDPDGNQIIIETPATVRHYKKKGVAVSDPVTDMALWVPIEDDAIAVAVRDALIAYLNKPSPARHPDWGALLGSKTPNVAK
jgi:hypothetical protein